MFSLKIANKIKQGACAILASTFVLVLATACGNADATFSEGAVFDVEHSSTSEPDKGQAINASESVSVSEQTQTSVKAQSTPELTTTKIEDNSVYGLVKKSRHDSDDSLLYYSEFKIDSNGNPLSEISYNPDGSKRVELKYDENYQPVKRTYYSFEGECLKTTFYEFKDNGGYYSSYKPNGDLFEEGEFNEKGQIVKRNYTDANVSTFAESDYPMYKCEYFYHQSGNPERSVLCDKYDKYIGINDYDTRGRTVKSRDFLGDGAWVTEYEYDEKNNVSRQERYFDEGDNIKKYLCVLINEYHDDGLLKKTTELDENGDIGYVHNYEDTYDIAYDNKDNALIIRSVDDDGFVYEYSEYEYDKNNNKTYEKNDSVGGTTTKWYAYDTQNTLIAFQKQTNSGYTIFNYIYYAGDYMLCGGAIDEKREVLSIDYESALPTFNRELSFSKEYKDNSGNCIRRDISTADGMYCGYMSYEYEICNKV